MTTFAVLLAAGGGTRFHGDSHKLLALLHGRPVISHAIAALEEAGFDEIGIVTGSVNLDAVIPSGMTQLANPNWAEGQATSLTVAVEFAKANGHDVLMVGLGDQPFVSADTWRRVARVGTLPIATASLEGQRCPPVRLDRSVWDLLPRDGDEGARVVMRAHPELVEVVVCEGRSKDIDTVEDLLEI
jgi:CTP:molybdopterin cytidylyltransferase MocA